MRRRHLKLPIETWSESTFKVFSNFMIPVINFFWNRRICLVRTQESLLGQFSWKKKAFGLRLPYSGIMFSFFWLFFGILTKMCVWAQSKSVLPVALGRKLHSAFVQSHKLKKWPPEADNYLHFHQFLDFSFFQKLPNWLVPRLDTWSGSKLATRSLV